MSWKVVTGDCVEQMRAMPEASIDAVVTDPPYGLEFMGKEWDRLGDSSLRARGESAVDSATRGMNEGALVKAPGFGRTIEQARAAQDWHEAWAREALRVLKPGGHLLAFGGTRTFHRLTCALEDAGFEIRDCLSWLYGQGFPKSRNVSKAIDQEAGVEREQGDVAYRATGSGRKTTDGKSMSAATPRDAEEYDAYAETLVYRTRPATPEAAEWEGWGTALKPSWEPIVLARKPLVGTVAANVLAHGTGAINIDGCRLAMGDEDREKIDNMGGWGSADWEQPEPGVALQGNVDGSLGQIPSRAHEGGRWPANAALSHLPECRPSGKRKVRTGMSGLQSRGFQTEYVGGELQQAGLPPMGYADERGQEVMDAWECAEGCPVKMLDEQSGEGAGSARPPTARKREGRDSYRCFDMSEGEHYGDQGGASRFFYTAKASRAERNAGLEGFARRAEKRTQAGGDDTRGRPTPVNRNTHPTVKGIDLMRWLVKLITPPGGTVLDCFTGSGSTGAATVLEGFNFVGIEREPEYADIARARIAFWAEHPTNLPAEAALAAERNRQAQRDAGQTSIFDLDEGGTLNGAGTVTVTPDSKVA